MYLLHEGYISSALVDSSPVEIGLHLRFATEPGAAVRESGGRHGSLFELPGTSDRTTKRQRSTMHLGRGGTGHHKNRNSMCSDSWLTYSYIAVRTTTNLDALPVGNDHGQGGTSEEIRNFKYNDHPISTSGPWFHANQIDL
jgi:hypothetical protein